MPTNKYILVVGGAGYLGSHMVKCLARAGYTPIVLDNLSTGHREQAYRAELIVGDMRDEKLLARIFSQYPIQAVMHFAGYIQINESVREPEKYYQNNLVGTLHLLNAMRKANVNKIVFSSTAAVYGNPTAELVNEKQPLSPINPYGQSKLMIETIMQDYARSYDLHCAILRYFNAAGADPDGELFEQHEPETHLIPLVLKAVADHRPITVFGKDYPTTDGTCIRDYIHVNDICDAHLLALHKIDREKILICNLGNGVGHSVLEVIHAAEEITGSKIKIKYADRRPGDPAILVADPSYALSKLQWIAKYPDLKTIIEQAWRALQSSLTIH